MMPVLSVQPNEVMELVGFGLVMLGIVAVSRRVIKPRAFAEHSQRFAGESIHIKFKLQIHSSGYTDG